MLAIAWKFSFPSLMLADDGPLTINTVWCPLVQEYKVNIFQLIVVVACIR